MCLQARFSLAKIQKLEERCRSGAHLGFLQGRGGFLKLGHNFFFQISSNNLRARVAILDLRGLQVYNIFNGTTMVGAVGKILKIMIARLFQIAILEL